MSKGLVTDTKLQCLGNKIRQHTGGIEELTLNEMCTEIQNNLKGVKDLFLRLIPSAQYVTEDTSFVLSALLTNGVGEGLPDKTIQLKYLSPINYQDKGIVGDKNNDWRIDNVIVEVLEEYTKLSIPTYTPGGSGEITQLGAVPPSEIGRYIFNGLLLHDFELTAILHAPACSLGLVDFNGVFHNIGMIAGPGDFQLSISRQGNTVTCIRGPYTNTYTFEDDFYFFAIQPTYGFSVGYSDLNIDTYGNSTKSVVTNNNGICNINIDGISETTTYTATYEENLTTTCSIIFLKNFYDDCTGVDISEKYNSSSNITSEYVEYQEFNTLHSVTTQSTDGTLELKNFIVLPDVDWVMTFDMLHTNIWTSGGFGINEDLDIFSVSDAGNGVHCNIRQNTNTWNHYKIIKNGSIYSVYINNILKGTTTNTNTGTLKFNICGDRNNFNYYFKEIEIIIS